MGNKKTYNEIKESLRNELSKSYKHRIEGLQSYAEKLRLVAKNAEAQRDRYREQLLKAQDENAQLKDWIERLCDYCNLSDNDRQLLLEEKIKQEKQKAKRKEKFSQYIWNSELFKFLNTIQQ